MREANDLKAQVDATRQKGVLLKKCIQPWMDEAFAVSTNIEGKLAHMQAASAPGETTELDTNASMTCTE